MSEQREYDLLIDIAKQIKKYGPETFENLASQISNPESTQQLADILQQAAKTARNSGINKGQSKALSRRDFRASLIELEKSDPERGEILIQFYDGLIARTFLPTLMEIRNFVSDNGLPPIKAKSRDKAIIPFTKVFLNMPLKEVKSHLQKLGPSSHQNDRSLEGWSNIIFGKEEKQKLEMASYMRSNKKCRRITTLPFLEIGCTCGVTFALKVVPLARNRLIFGRQSPSNSRIYDLFA